MLQLHPRPTLFPYTTLFRSASTATGIHGLAEENEDIKVHVVNRDQAYKWVEDGVINNAASIIALQWLQLNYLNLKNEWK